jgi:hypothetical protein
MIKFLKLSNNETIIYKETQTHYLLGTIFNNNFYTTATFDKENYTLQQIINRLESNYEIEQE